MYAQDKGQRDVMHVAEARDTKLSTIELKVKQ